MTDYEYDENLPYVVVGDEGDVMGKLHTKFMAEVVAARYITAKVIDTTPKPRVPEDAKYITWLGRWDARWYAERWDGVWIVDDGDEVEDIDHFPDVTPDTVFTVLDARDERGNT